MRFAVVYVLLATVWSASASAALAPRQSQAPSCTYTCPSTDKSSWQNVGNNSAGDTLTCYYYPTNQYSDKYYCQYNTKTGAITKDADATFCRPNATRGVCTRSHDNAQLDAYKAKIEARAAMPAPSIPQYMSQRAALGQRKLLSKRTD